jgi:hypothetical protein
MVALLPERLSERPRGFSSSPNRKAHPDFGRGWRRQEVLESAEEAFDEVAVAIEDGAERRAAFGWLILALLILRQC